MNFFHIIFAALALGNLLYLYVEHKNKESNQNKRITIYHVHQHLQGFWLVQTFSLLSISDVKTAFYHRSWIFGTDFILT